MSIYIQAGIKQIKKMFPKATKDAAESHVAHLNETKDPSAEPTASAVGLNTSTNPDTSTALGDSQKDPS